MPGLVPGIHAFFDRCAKERGGLRVLLILLLGVLVPWWFNLFQRDEQKRKTWMAGSSPAMTY